jgi:hypothetical protein
MTSSFQPATMNALRMSRRGGPPTQRFRKHSRAYVACSLGLDLEGDQ